jgi:tetratricopeptide (TPR) repeat protein
MRKLFDSLAARLRAFIGQRDDFVLVVRCPELEAAYVLKALQAVEEADGHDLHWMYTDPFSGPAPYVARVVEQFGAIHTAVREEQRKQGDEPWPDLPAAVVDASGEPVRRLRSLMTISRSLLPATEGHLSVWGLFPSSISDPDAYARFVAALARHGFPNPWCRQLRIIVRDDPGSGALAGALRGSPRVAWYEPDLSQQAMAASLEAEADDERLPLPERLQSLLVLAGLDYGHRRYAEAQEKYRLLLRYYRAAGDHTHSALVLNGIGEVHERRGELDEARRYYESALTPALEAQSQPMLLNIALNLANLELSRGRWAEAEAYYDGAEKLATAMLQPQVKIQALENGGFCRSRQGDAAGALASWEAAATLARGVGEPNLLKSVLRRLEGHFRAEGPKQRLREVQAELAGFGV